MTGLVVHHSLNIDSGPAGEAWADPALEEVGHVYLCSGVPNMNAPHTSTLENAICGAALRTCGPVGGSSFLSKDTGLLPLEGSHLCQQVVKKDQEAALSSDPLKNSCFPFNQRNGTFTAPGH